MHGIRVLSIAGAQHREYGEIRAGEQADTVPLAGRGSLRPVDRHRLKVGEQPVILAPGDPRGNRGAPRGVRIVRHEEEPLMATAVASDLKTQMYIDGAWCDARDGRTLSVINPADESVIAEVAHGGRADADRAIEAAARAFPAWRAVSVSERAKVLKKTAELLRERADRIARTMTMEQGKPLAEARTEVLHSADTFEWFAEEGKRAYGRIIPAWNVAKRHYAIK